MLIGYKHKNPRYPRHPRLKKIKQFILHNLKPQP